MFFKYTVKQNRSAQGTGKLPLAEVQLSSQFSCPWKRLGGPAGEHLNQDLCRKLAVVVITSFSWTIHLIQPSHTTIPKQNHGQALSKSPSPKETVLQEMYLATREMPSYSSSSYFLILLDSQHSYISQLPMSQVCSWDWIPVNGIWAEMMGTIFRLTFLRSES